MRKQLIALLALWVFAVPGYADSGLVNVKSVHDVDTTVDRLESTLKSKGMKIFARIDHAKGAGSVGKELRPTELLIFGNPKIGSVLMACAQSTGIDLPQKALVWEDQDKNVWLSYNDPGYLMERHAIGDCQATIDKISGALAKFAEKAASND